MISRDDRGVSELVGFTLSFGIIMASIALLYGFGYPGIIDYQEHEQLNNAERSFDAMAENFDDVAPVWWDSITVQ
ncbi:MAG: hypothetical protein U5K37_06770 [Natrialbaceae archaeon]|nr:hypothetical protein [Natrialbaceae archaeon]